MTRRRARGPKIRLGAAARIAAGLFLLLFVLFLGVFPTRTYLEQRRSIASTAERLEVFAEENDRLRAQVDALQNEDEIERIAREQYNLARPGEEVYVIIPSPLEGVRRQGGPTQIVETIRRAWGLSDTTGEDSPAS